MGIPKPVAIRMLLEQRYTGPRAIDQAWIDEIHAVFVENMIRFYREDASVAEMPGTSDVFRLLKQRKLKLVVDTGFDRRITEPLLDRLGWRRNNLIDASVTSDEVANGRPHPDMIFRAMELTGVTHVRNVAKIGDTASDIQEGRSAGCALVIGVTTGAFSEAALQAENPTHIIHNLHELPAILDNKA
jgi:phosphonatase-like hydrolase